MPIYEYWCPKCGKEFEQMRPMSQSADPASCPTCGTASEKLPSVFASKENYTIKVPRGAAFRQRTPAEPAPQPAAEPAASGQQSS